MLPYAKGMRQEKTCGAVMVAAERRVVFVGRSRPGAHTQTIAAPVPVPDKGSEPERQARLSRAWRSGSDRTGSAASRMRGPSKEEVHVQCQPARYPNRP